MSHRVDHGRLVDAQRPYPTGPLAMFAGAWRERRLILQLAQRDALGRYRGSLMGVAWSFLYPVLMLVVFTFVFSVVFAARWPGSMGGEGHGRFALVLFVGVISHALFAEVLVKSPQLVLSHANYVKKVVFPLETLAWSMICSAGFHMLVSLSILMLATLVLTGGVPIHALWLPVILLPLLGLGLGLAWLLSSLGVFLRDIGQVTGVLATVMMFLSPVFYPITALPESFRSFIYANPITLPIEQARGVLFAAQAPDLGALSKYYLVAFAMMCFGYWWFQRTRRGFADVL